MEDIICWSRVLPHRGLGRVFFSSCFYWVVARGSPDVQASVDGVDCEFQQITETLGKLKYGTYHGYNIIPRIA